MDKILPKTAQKLTLKHWSTLMFHRYLKYGKNSEEWKDATSTVNKLIQLLQPIESSHAYNRLDTEQNELLDSVHTGLINTKQNPVDIETEINNVFLIFENMLENSKFNPSNTLDDGTYFISVEPTDNQFDDSHDDQPLEPVLEFEEEIIDPLLEQAQIARSKIAMLPQEIRPGVWFKVYNGEDSAARRVKLSVIIMEEAKLVFVDRMGVKVIEKDAELFTNELANNTSQIIADHSAFDHALGMVITSLSATA